MRERPILFSGEMVRAILDGRKTQTRQLVNLREFGPSDTVGWDWAFRDRRGQWNEYTTPQLLESRWVRFHVGDRLWVREAWQMFDPHQDGDLSVIGAERFANGRRAPWVGVTNNRPIEWTTAYRADGEINHPTHGPAVWRPSIHMPRWASRITLEVTDVRVQRLQDISEDDAREEGVHAEFEVDLATFVRGRELPTSTYVLGFKHVWNHINGKRTAWDSNPWVWAISFRVVS